jgi:hypothetical protein
MLTEAARQFAEKKQQGRPHHFPKERSGPDEHCHVHASW